MMKKLLCFVKFSYFISTFFLCHTTHASVMNCSGSDLEALLDFKSGLNDPEGRLSSWKRQSNCCEWSGISCDNTSAAVIKVDIHNPYPVQEGFDIDEYGLWNLSGQIRPSLLKLKSLKYLDLSYNTFEGITIPEFLGSLNSLQYLKLSKAGFAGSVPPTLGNLSSLQYLDISSQSLIVNSFQWISGLVSLKNLDLSHSDLSSIEPNWLETLNMLPYLFEIYLASTSLPVGSISSLSYINFTSLSVIDLGSNPVDDMFPSWLVNVSSLTDVDFSWCSLRGRMPLGFGELPNLRYLDLAMNHNLSTGDHRFLGGSWKKLEVLILVGNNLHGKLPSTIGNMTSLTHLDMSYCNIEGGIPTGIWKLCYLTYLDLSNNKLSGSLPESLEGYETCVTTTPLHYLVELDLSNNQLMGKLPDWLGQLFDLQTLNLAYNLLDGPIPDFIGGLRKLESLCLQGNLLDGPIPYLIGGLRKLETILLRGNKLNGSLPESFGQLAHLDWLDVGSNQLSGIVSDNHFANTSELYQLDLSSNSFIINFSSNWIPPFQLYSLEIGSCKVGPLFPACLQNQKTIQVLDLSNSSISGLVPEWFWDISFNIWSLNFSHNDLRGRLPNPIVLGSSAILDLSFNSFNGTIPLSMNRTRVFHLSNNRFEGHIPRNIGETMPNLSYLSLSGNKLTGDIPPSLAKLILLTVIDLSSNNLTGTIPDLEYFSSLTALDLGNNYLSGEIPSSLGQLNNLLSLHLNDNKLSGELPSSFKNLFSIEILDIHNNLLYGNILPLFEDGFTHLRILNLRSNRFRGNISTWNTSNLHSLQVLDLAGNSFSGRVPASFGDLQAMAREPNLTEYNHYGQSIGRFTGGAYYEEGVVLNVKNNNLKYTKTLSLLTVIDISDNNFSREFPSELLKLSCLRVLNLSRNRIRGQIPQDISRLGKLELLDLSSNNLSGSIPPSMVSMSAMGSLNLSNNNLSGTIPYTGQMLTFSSLSFEGNPRLCGGPLEKCQHDDADKKSDNQDDSDNEEFIDEWFYLTLGIGFSLGILLPYLIMAIRKPWSYAYFDLVDNLAYRLLIIIKMEPRSRNRNARPQIRFHT